MAEDLIDEVIDLAQEDMAYYLGHNRSDLHRALAELLEAPKLN